MNENFQTFYWSKLDNVAKLYALVSNSRATNVFRVSVKLKETICPTLLNDALRQALLEMPSFRVRLRHGLFWSYFDMNVQRPKVRKEYTYPCSKMTKFTNNNYLFNVTYYENFIHLEVFHALADGAAAVQFLKVIVYYYLKNSHPNQTFPPLVMGEEETSLPAMDEDSFLNVKSDVKGKVIPTTTVAYRIKGIKKRPQELKVIHGTMSTKQVIASAKGHHVSVSSFLCAVLIYSIYEQNYRFNQTNRPMIVTVPFDLRRHFNSQTLRNFFFNVDVVIQPTPDLTFESLLQQVDQQLKNGKQLDVIRRKIKDNVSAQKNMMIRFVPLVIKNMVMRHIYREADKGVTTTVSNLGKVEFLDELTPYIEEVRVLIPLTPHQTIRCGVVSYQDQFTITFTSSLEEVDVQRYFFRFLRKYGIEPTISCNEEFNHEILF